MATDEGHMKKRTVEVIEVEMANAGLPNQHTTTTTVTSSTTVRTDLRFDPDYVKTIPGILKAAQIVLNLIGFICIEATQFRYHSRGTYFNFVSMTGFWVTGILLLFYLFHLIEKLYQIPWLHIEFGFCALWSLLYLIAACLAATLGVPAYEAAAFFGFSAMVCYIIDACLKVLAILRGELAQGERVVNKQVTTATSPTTY